MCSSDLKNKRDIFESIVQRMFEIDTERSQHYEVPKEKYEDAPMNYEKVLIENIKNFTAAQFRFWTEDDFASNFRKMLTLEQYRNTEMAELYSDCITLGPVTYMEDIFREMILKGMLKKADPKQLAIEFYAPMYLLINISDTSTDKEKLLDLLNVHIQKFIQNNIMEG